ncbi:MAG: hypothetical protein J0H22_10020 [Actinobacteria bacterium]|nr:hypothetical protein [Actinomycetota bacterium]
MVQPSLAVAEQSRCASSISRSDPLESIQDIVPDGAGVSAQVESGGVEW